MSNQVVVAKLQPSQNLRVNCSLSDSQLVALENTDLKLFVIHSLIPILLSCEIGQKTGCPCEGRRFSGDSSGEVTPVPIPNTVVKLSKADDTGISRESRSLPDLCPARRKLCGAFFLLNAGSRGAGSTEVW